MGLGSVHPNSDSDTLVHSCNAIVRIVSTVLTMRCQAGDAAISSEQMYGKLPSDMPSTNVSKSTPDRNTFVSTSCHVVQNDSRLMSRFLSSSPFSIWS